MDSEKRNYRNYKCKICNKLFQKPSLLRRHEIGHSNIKPFECNECDQKFTQKSSFVRHQSNVHLKLKRFPCTKCNARFSQYTNLVTHIKRIHNPEKEAALCISKDNTCNDDNVEQTAANIIKELESWQNFQYNISENSFTNTIPDKNECAPETVKVISCGSERFVTIIDNLDSVKKIRRVKEIIENENKWFQCSLCTKKFRRPHDLLRHFRCHTKEKTFECDMCKKKFALKCTLKIHMKVHKNIKSSKTNKSKPHVKKKLVNIEIDSNTHKANDENTIKNSERNLSEHVKVLARDNLQVQQICSPEVKTNKGILECETCGKSFKKPIDLKRHVLIHTKEKNFSCEICEKKFTLKCTLKDHLKIHSENRTKVECQICGKKYTNKSVLKVHIRIHFNELPYSCDDQHCTKTFRTIGHKKQHLKHHRKNSTSS